MPEHDTIELLPTLLHTLHVAQGAKMMPFAGYDMPVQFKGIVAEHSHTRTSAGLFDVSHMGQVIVSGPDRVSDLEQLMPIDLKGLPAGRQRYGLLLNDTGGILDDLMVANYGDHFCVVVNAACKAADVAHLRAYVGAGTQVAVVEDRALIALQGPMAETVLAGFAPDVAKMRFMDARVAVIDGHEAWITRSGYTGEDGYEISLPVGIAQTITEQLLDHDLVEPIGLGARDTLRLEAGLCLYGHDIDDTTSPIEAGLAWAIQKRRRSEGGFPGAERILSELAQGPARQRVGLLPDGRAPMREGVVLYETADSEPPIGHVTSGGFGPTVQRPVAMGYVPTALATPGTTLFGDVRGKRLPVHVAPLPFVTANFKR